MGALGIWAEISSIFFLRWTVLGSSDIMDGRSNEIQLILSSFRDMATSKLFFLPGPC